MRNSGEARLNKDNSDNSLLFFNYFLIHFNFFNVFLIQIFVYKKLKKKMFFKPTNITLTYFRTSLLPIFSPKSFKTQSSYSVFFRFHRGSFFKMSVAESVNFIKLFFFFLFLIFFKNKIESFYCGRTFWCWKRNLYLKLFFSFFFKVISKFFF